MKEKIEWEMWDMSERSESDRWLEKMRERKVSEMWESKNLLLPLRLFYQTMRFNNE